MTDPDFYRRDRPLHTRLSEDRPRGSTPGKDPGSSFKAFWVGGILLLVLLVVLMVGMLA